MKKTKIWSLLICLCLVLSMAQLVACRAPEESATPGGVGDTVTLAVQGEVLTEYTVPVSKINLSGGVLALFEYLDGIDALDYSMNGTMLNSVGEIENGEGGKYIYLFTSVESDFDVSVYSKTAEYGGRTLTSARVGINEMKLEAGAVIYVALVSF